MPRSPLIPEDEAKYLHRILTDRQYKQLYQRLWREANPQRRNAYHREHSRTYYRANRERILAKQHKKRNRGLRGGGIKFQREVRKLAYTYHDLIAMSSMERFVSTVNRIIGGELMLTFNSDETDKQKMVV